jgi:hypothetical protein
MNPLSETRTGEYRVEHPRWRFAHAKESTVELGDLGYYGERFSTVLKARPHSTFVAEGSPIQVVRRNVLPGERNHDGQP